MGKQVKHKLVTVIDAYDFNEHDNADDVTDDIEKMWQDYEHPNDIGYQPWDKGMTKDYPHLSRYIENEGITGVILIHYWW